MKKGWVLSQDAFDGLLKWLDHDRERAARKYETIRLGLIKIFTCRGCSEAEDLTDETINRVVTRLPEVAQDYHGDPILYFVRVSQKVQMEYARKSRRVTNLEDAPEAPAPMSVDVEADEDERYACLEKCLEHLAAHDRQLVVGYYQQEKRAKINHRKQLAAQLGIAVNALRIRAYRIRQDLRNCVRNCVSEQPAN